MGTIGRPAGPLWVRRPISADFPRTIFVQTPRVLAGALLHALSLKSHSLFYGGGKTQVALGFAQLSSETLKRLQLSRAPA